MRKRMCEGYPPGYGFVQEWKVGGILIKSCVFGPLLCGGAGAVAAATLHLLYYFIYLGRWGSKIGPSALGAGLMGGFFGVDGGLKHDSVEMYSGISGI